MADVSIEQTNIIRASLGMKPLPVPGGGGKSGPSFKDNDSSSDSEKEEEGSTLESRQAQGYDNWKALQDQADAKRKREAKAESIKKARDAAQKFSRLEGKGLGDEDEGELDTKTWLLQQKKRRKRIEKEREKAEKLERELAEREAAVQHTAADLEGVNVTHALDDFEGENILTLKDATIDQNEEEGDELENLEMRERETLNEKLNLKKKKPVYDPHADEEEGASKILQHYDEAIDGKKRKQFQLDGQGVSAEDREALKKAVGAKINLQSLDIIKDDVPTSDYADMVEIKVKKSKKKARTTRKRAADADDIFPVQQTDQGQTNGNSMDVDTMNGQPTASKPKPTENDSLFDDDYLQDALATQRRAALKKRKRTRPEDIARQLREEASATPGETPENPAAGDGLVIDETSEFVANLQRAKEEEDRKPKRGQVRSATPMKEESPEEDKDPDIAMEDYEDTHARLQHEASGSAITGTGLDDDVTLSNGMGATLSMLSQRGLITPRREEDIVGLHRDRQRFLLEKQRREAEIERKARAQRERDRASGRLDQMSAREREDYQKYENRQRDQMESRAMTEIFNKDYKPDISLKYMDDDGRMLQPKEAFKFLSHGTYNTRAVILESNTNF